MSTVETTVGRFVWHDHMSGDPAAASRFYSELLGWEIEIWKPGEMDYPMIKVGEHQHGGFDRHRAAPRRTGSATSRSTTSTRRPGARRPRAARSSRPRSTSLRSGAWSSWPTRRARSCRSSPAPPSGRRPRRLRLGRVDDHGRRGLEALLRRGRGLGEPRHGHGQLRLHDLRVGRRRPGGLRPGPRAPRGCPRLGSPTSAPTTSTRPSRRRRAWAPPRSSWSRPTSRPSAVSL